MSFPGGTRIALRRVVPGPGGRPPQFVRHPVYHFTAGEKLGIITETARPATTVLMPEDYRKEVFKGASESVLEPAPRLKLGTC